MIFYFILFTFWENFKLIVWCKALWITLSIPVHKHLMRWTVVSDSLRIEIHLSFLKSYGHSPQIWNIINTSRCLIVWTQLLQVSLCFYFLLYLSSCRIIPVHGLYLTTMYMWCCGVLCVPTHIHSYTHFEHELGIDRLKLEIFFIIFHMKGWLLIVVNCFDLYRLRNKTRVILIFKNEYDI